MKKLARAISFFLGPIFIIFPIIFILVSRVSNDYSYALKWTIFSYAFVLAVALFVIAGVMAGFFTNFDVSKKEQRPLLFAFCAFIIFCYLTSLFILNGPKVLFVALFAIVLGLMILIVINKWIKASIHLATFTSFALFIAITYGGFSFLLLALIPVLAWSRIKLKEHTLPETVIGTILGIMITLTVYLITKYYLIGLILD